MSVLIFAGLNRIRFRLAITEVFLGLPILLALLLVGLGHLTLVALHLSLLLGERTRELTVAIQGVIIGLGNSAVVPGVDGGILFELTALFLQVLQV